MDTKEYSVNDLRPLRGMCILKRDEEDVMTDSGLIHIPDGASMREKNVKATVVKMGNFAIKKGKEQVVEFVPGDKVMCSTEAGWRQEVNGEDYYFTPQEAVSTTLTEDN